MPISKEDFNSLLGLVNSAPAPAGTLTRPLISAAPQPAAQPAQVAPMATPSFDSKVTQWDHIVVPLAEKYPNVPADLVRATIQQESGGDPGIDGDPTPYGRAKGLGQFIDLTAKDFIPGWTGPQDSYDPQRNVEGIYRYFDYLINKNGGNIAEATKDYYGRGTHRTGPTTEGYSGSVMSMYSGGTVQPQPQTQPRRSGGISQADFDALLPLVRGEKPVAPVATQSMTMEPTEVTPEVGMGSAMASAGVAGLAGATKGFFSIPAAAASTFLLGSNAINKGLNFVLGRKVFDDNVKTPDILTDNKLVQVPAQVEKEQSQRAKQRFGKDETAVDLISEGRIGKTAEYIGQFMLQQAPNSVMTGAMMFAGLPKMLTLGVMGASTAGAKEVENKGKVDSGEISQIQSSLDAVLNGAAEMGGEAAGEYKVLEGLRDAFQRVSKVVGPEVAKETFGKTMQRVVKGFINGAGKEAPAEAVTSLAQGLTDKFTGSSNASYDQIWKDAVDAGIVTVFMGGVPGAATGAKESTNIRADQKFTDRQQKITIPPGGPTGVVDGQTEKNIRSTITGKTLSELGVTDEQFSALPEAEQNKIFDQLSGEEAVRIEEVIQRQEGGAGTATPPIESVESGAAAAVNAEATSGQPEAPEEQSFEPIYPSIDKEAIPPAKDKWIKKQLDRLTRAKNEQEREAIIEQLPMDEKWVSDQVAALKSKAPPSPDVSNIDPEEAAAILAKTKEKVQNTSGNATELKGTKYDRQKGEDFASQVPGVKFEGVNGIAVKGKKPQLLLYFNDEKNGGTTITVSANADANTFKKKIMDARKAFSEKPTTPEKGEPNALQNSEAGTETAGSVKVEESPGKEIGKEVTAVPPEPKVETVTATQPEVVAPPVLPSEKGTEENGKPVAEQGAVDSEKALDGKPAPKSKVRSKGSSKDRTKNRKYATVSRKVEDEKYGSDYWQQQHAHEVNVDLYNALFNGYTSRTSRTEQRSESRKQSIDDYNILTDYVGTDDAIPGGSENPVLSDNAKKYLQEAVDGMNEDSDVAQTMKSRGIDVPQNVNDLVDVLRNSKRSEKFKEFHRQYENNLTGEGPDNSALDEAIRTMHEEPYNLTVEQQGMIEEAYGDSLDNILAEYDDNDDGAVSDEEAPEEPTEAQKEAGNYKKEHIRRDGFEISIENKTGSTRSGTDKSGKAWSQKINHDYGYIRGTKGADAFRTKDGTDQVDVFIKPDSPEGGPVFIVNQNDPGSGRFDEHKVMVGFESADEAKSAYLSNYEKGWKGFGSIVEMPMDKFKEWVYTDATKKPAEQPKQLPPDQMKQQDLFGEEKSVAELEADEKAKLTKKEIADRIEKRKGGEADLNNLPMFEDQDFEGSQRTIKFAKGEATTVKPTAPSDKYANSTDAALSKIMFKNSGKPARPGAVKVFFGKSTPEMKATKKFIEDATGKQVVFIETDPGTMAELFNGSTIDGLSVPGSKNPALQNKVFIDVNSRRPIMWTGFHEFAHFLEMNTTLMSRFWNAAKLTETGVKAWDDAGSTSEFQADIIGEMMSRQEFWQNLEAQGKGTVEMVLRQIAVIFSKIINSLKRVIAGLPAEQRPKYEQYVTDAEALRKEVMKIYSDYRKSEQGKDEMPERMAAAMTDKTDQTKTPAFRKWFEGSKVVNENGEPLVVYHGAKNGNITEFKTEKINENFTSRIGRGFYFTDNPRSASYYAEETEGGGSPAVLPIFLSTKNPLIIKSVSEYRSAVSKAKEDLTEGNRKKLDDIGGKDGNEILAMVGYDGVIDKSNGNMSEIVVFSPTQIKSATGNSGTFNPENPDIRFAKSAPLTEPAPENEPSDPVEIEKKKLSERLRARRELREMYQRVSLSATGKTNREFRDFKDNLAEDLLTPMSTRLKHLGQSFKDDLHRLTMNIGLRQTEDAKAVRPLLKKMEAIRKKIPGKYRGLDLLLKAGNDEVTREIIAELGLTEEYKAMRKALDDLHRRAAEVGFDINYIKEYWPRSVINAPGLLEYVRKTPMWGPIEQAIKNEEEKLKRPLDEYEKAKIVNAMITRPDLLIDAPGALKERTIKTVTEEMDKFYDDSMSAMIKYVHEMNEAIETKRFLGKGEEAEKIINIDLGIGRYVVKAIAEGRLNPEQQDELIGIWKARFNYRPSGGVIQKIKEIGYLTAMGSGFSSFISQIQDLTWAVYVAGPIRAAKYGAISFAMQSELKKEDLGFDRIGEELRTTRGYGQLLNKVFKATLLQRFDNLGKETFINAYRDKLKSQAKKGDAKLKARVKELFGKEADQVMADLAAGTMSENVKYLIGSRLLDFQPAALSEMPVAYLRHPSGRIFYMLKTFTVKQLDIFRNEGIDLIAEGLKSKDKGKIAKGMLNLSYLIVLFGSAGLGTDAMKDWLFRRKPIMKDRVWDNIYKLAGVSRFVAYKMREDPRSGFTNLVFPPLNVIFDPWDDLVKVYDTIINDPDDEKEDLEIIDFESWKNIPLFGKHFYWGTPFTGDFGGGGIEKEIKRQDKREKDEFRGYAKKFYAPRTGSNDRKDYQKWYITLKPNEKVKFSEYAKRWYSRNKKKPSTLKRLSGK
jgi:hypothetical protein